VTTPEAGAAQRALALRLRAVAPILLTHVPEQVPAPAEDSARLLIRLASSLVADPVNHRVWLTLSAIAAAFPTRDDVDQVRRRLELVGADEAAAFLIDFGLAMAKHDGSPLATVQVLTGQVLVDVDFTARHDLHTGVQRVVRQTVPLWNRNRDVTPVVWTSTRGALRQLDAAESARTFQWSATPLQLRPAAPDAGDGELVVIPWRSVVVLPEVPAVDVTPRIAGIGACSNNKVVAIGHDFIPLTSADTLDIEEPRKFMSYLSALKFASRIAGVSHSSTSEFAAFGSMLSSQGLPAPVTIAVTLPADIGGSDASEIETQSPRHVDSGPDVVVVGSHDTRKNHLAVLHAAEMLWADGLQFRLTFIGGGGSNLEFQRRIEMLSYQGRQVETRTAVPDDELKAAVSAARFTVFPSLHEGYGLPVAESMALGTPVITTDYGATAEIAKGGGAVTVDPRDDSALTDAMRRLLTDDSEITRLRAEIDLRAERSWQVYADELWDRVVGPTLDDVARTPVHEGP
jgi:glycosyltransferase involved in cell wall biosynthesis